MHQGSSYMICLIALVGSGDDFTIEIGIPWIIGINANDCWLRGCSKKTTSWLMSTSLILYATQMESFPLTASNIPNTSCHN